MEKMNNQAYLQWEFQEPKLEIPTIYKAYVREYPHKIWPYMVQYLHFMIISSKNHRKSDALRAIQESPRQAGTSAAEQR
jgi:hypothetical protein